MTDYYGVPAMTPSSLDKGDSLFGDYPGDSIDRDAWLPLSEAHG
jgi:hypothetical protein